MRVLMITCWLALPLLAWAYHVGPGQKQLRMDQAGSLLTQARYAASEQDFENAKSLYTQALTKLPKERKQDQFAIRLAMAQTQMESNQLPEARFSLETLLEELQSDTSASTSLLTETRTTLAHAQYYMTWLMRLEGLPAETWEPEIEASRQNFRLLAEAETDKGTTASISQRKHDLESAIRLARLDLSDLQAMKIPSKCKSCCSGQCKKPSRKQGKPKSSKKGAGANLGPLPDGSGS